MKNFLTKTKSIFTIFALAVIFFCSGVFVACGDDEDADNALELNKSAVQIVQYDTVTLNVSVSGSLKIGDVVWSTSNKEIATVEGGVVTAVACGEAEIKNSPDHMIFIS